MTEVARPRLPWARTDQERNDIEIEARALVGRRVRAVNYVSIDSEGHSPYSRHKGFDSTEIGLEFETEDHELISFAWVLQGFTHGDEKPIGHNQGLAVGTGSIRARAAVPNLTFSDVTSKPEWERRVGRPIAEVTLMWSRQEEEDFVGIWAIRVKFESAEPIVVALGEARTGGGLAYTPKSVVILFDMSLARSFEAPASEGTAFGN